MKERYEETYKFSSFVVVGDDLYRQQTDMGLYVSMSLSCPVKLGAAAVSFLSLLCCLLVLLKGAYAKITLSEHCSPFGIWHREVFV